MSKYLAKHLRHQPERLGLVLRPGKWVGIDELLEACSNDGFALIHQELDEVIATSDKQRFALDETGKSLRANRGTSRLERGQWSATVSGEVDLGLEVAER